MVLSVHMEYLEVPDVGEEEAEEGEGQRPLGHRADDVSRVALKRQHAHRCDAPKRPRLKSSNTHPLSRSPVQFVGHVHAHQSAVHDDRRHKH